MQCVIDVTGFRFKETSWSEARIKLSPMDPWMLNMTTCTDRQTINFSFFVRNYGSSECVGGWKFVVVHYFQEAIWFGSVKEGTSKD